MSVFTLYVQQDGPSLMDDPTFRFAVESTWRQSEELIEVERIRIMGLNYVAWNGRTCRLCSRRLSSTDHNAGCPEHVSRIMEITKIKLKVGPE